VNQSQSQPKPQPQSPAPITTRSELLDALTMACELEHGLSLQYLFAAFSLRSDPDDGLTRNQLIRVRTWASSIFFVAAQEMFHLAQASNLLLAIGGAPHLARPNFPQPPGIYPTDLGWELTGFSAATIDRFIAYESATASTGPSTAGDRRLPHETIGEMYEAIADAFERLDIPDGVLFVGAPDDQILGSQVDFPMLIEVTNRTNAVEACRLVIAEGEGSRADTADCHEGVFRTIRRELDEFDPSVDPARPVADNPLARSHGDVGPSGPDAIVNPIADPITRAVQEVSNATYDVLVLALLRYFAGGRHDPAAPTVKAVTLQLMTTVIRPLGELLTRLPMGEGYDGLTAGPSFEMSPDVELLPHPHAARTLMAEQLAVAARDAAQIADEPVLSSRDASVLVVVADNLARFAAMLETA